MQDVSSLRASGRTTLTPISVCAQTIDAAIEEQNPCIDHFVEGSSFICPLLKWSSRYCQPSRMLCIEAIAMHEHRIIGHQCRRS